MARTERRDRWWLAPLSTGTLLVAFVGYSGWAALQTSHYAWGPYISPIFSPCLATSCGSHTDVAVFGRWWAVSPALIVAGFPVGFRLTCYYYRRAYYRSLWMSPPACAVREPHRRYSGETRFPLIVQNVHRYFFYFGVLVAIMLSVDAVRAFDFPGGWGIGLGSLILATNTVLFWCYALGCHSCRHLIGGRIKHFSRHPIRYRAWKVATVLNARHMAFAWASLPCVVLTDLYIRLVSMGVFADPRLL